MISINNVYPSDYCVIDVETTGLNNSRDDIIEYGALRVKNDEIVAKFNVLVKTEYPLPPKIVEITGITTQMLENGGIDRDAALAQFLEFVGDLPCVGHNVAFDCGFIRAACVKTRSKLFLNKTFDTLAISKSEVLDIRDHKLKTLAEYFGIVGNYHRALGDCEVTKQIFDKLKSKVFQGSSEQRRW